MWVVHLMLALAALYAVVIAGMYFAQNVSIIGYDDTMAEILTPPLTSVAQPIAELGRNAVTLALEAIADLSALARKTVSTRLVVRGSTGRPR